MYGITNRCSIHEEQIRAWITGAGAVKGGKALTLVKGHGLLAWQRCWLPYRTANPLRVCVRMRALYPLIGLPR